MYESIHEIKQHFATWKECIEFFERLCVKEALVDVANVDYNGTQDPLKFARAKLTCLLSGQQRVNLSFSQASGFIWLRNDEPDRLKCSYLRRAKAGKITVNQYHRILYDTPCAKSRKYMYRFRKKRGATIDEMANMSMCSAGLLHCIEYNKDFVTHPNIAKRIAQAYQLTDAQYQSMIPECRRTKSKKKRDE